MAEEKFQLTYGGERLPLKKSGRLVAVKAKAGMEKKAEAAIRSGGAVRDLNAERLGGFKVVELDYPPDETNEELDRLRHDPSIATGSHVFHTSDDGVPFVPTGSLFLIFKDGVPADEQEAIIARHALEILEARDGNEFIVRVTPESPNPIKVAADLQNSGAIEVCEPELATPGQLTGFTVPSGGLLDDQWHLRNTGRHRGTQTGFRAGADARVLDAWSTIGSWGSPQVLVAVIDDGFDLAHPDLGGQGKVVSPWDFTRRSNDPSPGAESEDWHGTACAGVAVGRSGGSGIFGAAPGATLMPVRWGIDLSDSQVEKWFEYVADRGAWIASCSWGAKARYFPLGTRRKRAIERCATLGRGGKGCVVVFAAGNENRNVDDPASASVNGFATHPDVIAVAASTSMDTRSSYSNFGAAISVCAPSSGAGGWGVLTCDVTGTAVIDGVTVDLGYNAGDYTYEFGGTSSACPLVAGVCALILSVHPDLSAREVKGILESTARPLGGQQGHVPEHGHGCINADAAVREALRLRGGGGAQLSNAA